VKWGIFGDGREGVAGIGFVSWRLRLLGCGGALRGCGGASDGFVAAAAGLGLEVEVELEVGWVDACGCRVCSTDYSSRFRADLAWHSFTQFTVGSGYLR